MDREIDAPISLPTYSSHHSSTASKTGLRWYIFVEEI
jgi:hypothetical protein